MARPSSWRAVGTALASSSFLIAATVAYGAVSRGFAGKTSQRQPISLEISGSSIRKLDYKIVDRCPGAQKLINHDFGFSAIPIKGSKFGGTFNDPVHHGKAVVKGRIKHGTVQGSLSDRTRSATTHKFCTGKAQFHLGHR
jgi:hypothetical protein